MKMEEKMIEAIAKFIAENTNADGDFGELSFRDFVAGDEKKIAVEIMKIIKPLIKS
jgi:hypothetical protein